MERVVGSSQHQSTRACAWPCGDVRGRVASDPLDDRTSNAGRVPRSSRVHLLRLRAPSRIARALTTRLPLTRAARRAQITRSAERDVTAPDVDRWRVTHARQPRVGSTAMSQGRDVVASLEERPRGNGARRGDAAPPSWREVASLRADQLPSSSAASRCGASSSRPGLRTRCCRAAVSMFAVHAVCSVGPSARWRAATT